MSKQAQDYYSPSLFSFGKPLQYGSGILGNTNNSSYRTDGGFDHRGGGSFEGLSYDSSGGINTDNTGFNDLLSPEAVLGDKSFFDGASMSDYGAALSGIGSVLGAGASMYGAFKNAGLAEKSLDFSKKAYYNNYYAQKEVNAARNIKQAYGRTNSTKQGGTSTLDSQLAANAEKYKAYTNT